MHAKREKYGRAIASKLFAKLEKASNLRKGCPSKLAEELGREWARPPLAAESKCKRKAYGIPFAAAIAALQRERRLLHMAGKQAAQAGACSATAARRCAPQVP